MNLNSTESNIIPKFNYRDLIIFLLPILIFGLYLFAYKPGILTAASYSQLHQIATGEFTNAYPILHTFIEIICLKIRASPSTIGLLQILVFSIMWTVICKYHRDDTASGNGFVFQFIVTMIICLIPINAVYSITLSSNILFSYALMFLCFLIKVLIDRDGQINDKLTILIALTLVAISGLNTFGVLIAIILLILIAFYLSKKGNSQNALIRLAAITVVCILLVTSLNFIYHADQDNTNFKMHDAFEDEVDLQAARSEFLSTSGATPARGYENVESTNLGNFKFDMVNSYVSMFRDNIILDGLFNNPILNLIYSVILLGFIYLIGKREILYVYVPVIVGIVIALITGRNNFYYVLLAFYLIAIIFLEIYATAGLKPRDLTSLATTKRRELKSQPKQEETYPEYSEPQEYEDNYSYIETELEELTLDDINEMLGETQTEEQTAPTQETPIEEPTSSQETPYEGDSDLIDEILKEIEMGKK